MQDPGGTTSSLFSPRHEWGRAEPVPPISCEAVVTLVTWPLSPKPPTSSTLSLVPAGPGEEDCAPCAPEASAPHWRCVPTCREGFYPADSHGLPNKVCKKYVASPVVTGAKLGLMGSTGRDDKKKINAETAHSWSCLPGKLK